MLLLGEELLNKDDDDKAEEEVSELKPGKVTGSFIAMEKQRGKLKGRKINGSELREKKAPSVEKKYSLREVLEQGADFLVDLQPRDGCTGGDASTVYCAESPQSPVETGGSQYEQFVNRADDVAPSLPWQPQRLESTSVPMYGHKDSMQHSDMEQPRLVAFDSPLLQSNGTDVSIDVATVAMEMDGEAEKTGMDLSQLEISIV